MSASDRVKVSEDGIQFFEPGLIHKSTLRLYGPVDGDTYLDLPTTSGTLATEEYVDAHAGGGGSPLRVSVLGAAVDITSQDEFVDVLSLSVEADSVYYVEGYCRPFTAVSVDLILSLPSGATFNGDYTIAAGGGATVAYWDGTQLAGGTSYYGSGATVKFSGVIDTAGTAGNLKLQAAQAVADATTTEIPVGTHIVITKAQ